MLGFSPLAAVPLSTLWNISGGVIVTPTGVELTTVLNSVNAYGEANVYPIGLQILGSVGTPIIRGEANTVVSGVQMNSYLGQVEAFLPIWRPVNDSQSGDWVDVRPRPRLYN